MDTESWVARKQAQDATRATANRKMRRARRALEAQANRHMKKAQALARAAMRLA